MENNVLVISQKETFIAMTLQKNLKNAGFGVYYSAPDVQKKSEFRDQVNIYLFYMDEGSAVDMDTVVYLKDMSIEEDTMVILIGSPDEFKEATKILPYDNMAASFTRPLDMRQFMDKMKELTDKQEIENRKKRVLIVDDDVTFLKMAYTWLKDKYRVSIVNSGMQAITWLAKNKADVVLLDYEMPVADGPSILEMLKSETGTDSIPVFILTGKSDLGSVKKVMELKPQGYLLKASGKDSLLDELEKFFISRKTLK